MQQKFKCGLNVIRIYQVYNHIHKTNQGVLYMTKENEIKLINTIALKHFGNAKFGKKYGIRCNGGNELLKPYLEKDIEPPEEILQESEQLFINDFTNQIIELLKKDMPEEFFKDLIFNII